MVLRGRNKIEECSLFFVTTTVVNFIDIFSDKKCCELLAKNILHYQNNYNFRILAYVFMPSHFHWILEVDLKYGSISDVMRDVKKYSAWDVLEYLEKNGSRYLHYFHEAALMYRDQNMKLWMKRFDDEVIRNMFSTRLQYIHNNPVKAGIVEKPEDYHYSSTRNYLGLKSALDVDVSYTGISIR